MTLLRFMKRFSKVIIASFTLSFVGLVPGSAFAIYKIDLTPKPNPPEAGDNTLQIKVMDEKGKPIEGAKVGLTIFMPAMGTMPRMEEKATVSEKSKGLYVAEYGLSMGGTWDLTLTIKKADKQEVYNYSLTTGISGLNSKNATKTTGAETSTNLLPIGPERLQKIGVKFVEAKVMAMEKTLRAVGVVEPDNTKKAEISLRFSGYVEKQFKGRIGDLVKAGAPLFSVYSPELVTAQSEFLLVHGENSESEVLHSAAKERLKNLGLSEKEILRVANAGKPQREISITAPQSGTILEVNVREGSSFNQGQLLYTIGDLSKNYLVARVFQRDLNNLHVGMPVEIVVPDAEQESYPGKIDLIYPSVSEGEGTANVRITATQYVSALKPGIYADLRFPVDFGNRLVVPAKAILYSGLHKYVFIDRGNGVLEPKEVTTGKTSHDLVEIKSGVKEGERVVASGAFLISSEAQLRSALPKWENTKQQGSVESGNQNSPSKSNK